MGEPNSTRTPTLLRWLFDRYQAWILVLASSAGASAFTFLANLLAAAVLLRSSYGYYAFFLATANLVSSVGDLGITQRVVTTYDSSLRNWTTPTLGSFWVSQMATYLAASVSVSLIGLTPLTTALDIPSVFFLLAGATGASVGLTSFLTGILQAQARWALRAKLQLVTSFCRALSTLAGLLAGSGFAAAAGSTFGSAAALLIALVILDEPLLRGASLQRLRQSARILATTRWFSLASLVGAATTYAPMVMVTAVAGPEAAAIFGLATTLGSIPMLLATTSMIVLLPPSADKQLPLSKYAARVRQVLVPTLALIVVYALAVAPMVRIIFDQDYAGAILPTQITLASIAVIAIANPIQFLHYRFDRERFLAFVEVLMFLTVVVAFWLLIGHTTLPAPSVAAISVLASLVLSRGVGVWPLLRLQRRQRSPSTPA